jgi:pyruvate formate-lyase/glycerol dehydratase family glycyl radical enzyme
MDIHFGKPSQRIKTFREKLMNAEALVCPQRAVLTTEAYKKYNSEQIDVLRARVLENILLNMDIFIEPETLLVGNQASQNRAAPIFPEYAMKWVIEELDSFNKRDGDIFQISEETKQQLREIAPYWENNTLLDRGLAAFPREYRKLYDLGIIKAEGNITSGDGHLAVNYGDVLSNGLQSYVDRATILRETLDLNDFENLKKLYFYDSIIIAVNAVIAFSNRFSKLATEMAGTETNTARKAELLEIARITSKVPAQPAETFHEALQATWLTHLVLQIESNGHSVSYGRLDQYVYPFYKKDLDAGLITEESAIELLENLWLKTFTINKIRPWSHTKFSAGSPLYQNVTVAGQTADGKSAVNPLSYLVLKSVARTHLPQPNLTVRYCHQIEPEFMAECVEVIRLGFGMPAFNNDEIIIPSFEKRGVSHQDAINYSAVGCVEVAVPGKWGYRCTGMSFINFPKTLLIAMNDGVDPESRERVWKGMGHFKDMKTFDEVFAAWDAIITDFARSAGVIDSCADLVLEQTVPDIFCSSLVDDCIGRGKTIKEGGAIYDFVSDLQVGIANLGDSLYAIKKCVYDDKAFTPVQLWEALQNDFAGETGSKIQMLLLNVPKYGNDEDVVDEWVVKGYHSYIKSMHSLKNTRFGRGPIGGVYYAGTSSISANVPQGAGTPATPDGRNAYQPLAEGCSPTHSADTHGPTAVFKSVSKLETDEITGGVLLNQKTTPQLLCEPEDKLKLTWAIRTFFDSLKGFHVQFNVVDKATLLDAQIHPEQHRDLIVRVAGYSAFFNVLSRQTQDDIIARTEQAF